MRLKINTDTSGDMVPEFKLLRALLVRGLRDEDQDWINSDNNDAMSFVTCCDLLGIEPDAVRRQIYQGQGIRKKALRRPKIANLPSPDSKIPRDRAILLFAEGETLSSIGKLLGVSKARVWQIVKVHPDFATIHKDHMRERQDRSDAKRYRECKACGKGFIDKNGGKVYCSTACRTNKQKV